MSQFAIPNPAVNRPVKDEATKKPNEPSQSLDNNIKSLNYSNSIRQLDRLEQRQKLGKPGGAGMDGFK